MKTPEEAIKEAYDRLGFSNMLALMEEIAKLGKSKRHVSNAELGALLDKHPLNMKQMELFAALLEQCEKEKKL